MASAWWAGMAMPAEPDRLPLRIQVPMRRATVSLTTIARFTLLL
ncbi:MAG TPA: hypothetical protein VGD99_02685 [Anaerolineae bacterium]